MGFTMPSGWEQDSETLYLHSSGARIERRVYRLLERWILVPVDLDRPVIEFSPTPEGMEQAFAAFARGLLESKDTVLTKEAREAARRDGDPFASSDDQEEDEEDES